MDFFGEQRSRTRRSLLLYGLFFGFVLLHIVVALGIVALLLTIFTDGVYYWALVLVVVWILGSFLAGSLLEYQRLKAGGRAIAQRVGAIRLFIDGSQDAWEHSSGIAHQHQAESPVRYSSRHIAVRHERDFPVVYRRYYEFAQQLAIASGLSMPVLYVLTNEQGINGFVAGRQSQDMVMVVTQGALDKLSDEALYGLIGHEYGHILHGDAKFNLQLMVVLAGLQLFYDWSDSINNVALYTHVFDNATPQDKPLSQREIDNQARHTEAQTAHFTTHSEWVTYWQQQKYAQTQTSSSASRVPISSSKLSAYEHDAPRNFWTLLLHGVSFSSMASAQLIKHSFNRQRELLADATSVQLTRSPAILATLKAIHQDAMGSRLSDIADINGLSHFFFANSGHDLGEVSWFATHPSLFERMSAINAGEYQSFAIQVATKQRLNAKKIKDSRQQQGYSHSGGFKENSLSYQAQWDKPATEKPSIAPNNKSDVNNANSANSMVFDKRENISHFKDDGLAFAVDPDVIINGRLQVADTMLDNAVLLKPWQSHADADLPTDALISAADIHQVSLPHHILNQSHHPLGAQAVIEAVMLCHQGVLLDTKTAYGLGDIWCGLPDFETTITAHHTQKILPHMLNTELLLLISRLDRRLDSALIALTLTRLRQHDLSETAVNALQQRSLSSHQLSDDQQYQQQLNARNMLLRYQQGVLELFKSQLNADLTTNIQPQSGKLTKNNCIAGMTCNSATPSPHPVVLSLWQALHLQALLAALSPVLTGHHNTQTAITETYAPILQASIEPLIAQLDPSKQTFKGLNSGERTMLILFAYRLASDTLADAATTHYKSSYVIDLRRHARLIDIDLTAVSTVNLQWLLLTAQRLNSLQLLALMNAVSPIEKIDQSGYNAPADNPYRLWLSTLHTVMLHDTIISQLEYDCLVTLAEHWLGVRQLFG